MGISQSVSKWFKRHPRGHHILLAYLIVIGLAALMMHLLSAAKLYHSSLLYILVPYLVSVAITVLRSAKSPTSVLQRYVSHLFTAAAIFLSSSLIVGEGFICIIFFAPIYFFVVSLSYLAFAKISNKRVRFTLIPTLVLFLSLEGVHENWSFPRENSVTIERVSHLSPAEIQENLAKPFDLRRDRHWLIALFPMPYHIDAGSLQPGDVHTVHTRYHRWIMGNTHEGKAELLIEEVSDRRIRTRVLSDSTYFSNYMSGSGTQIDLLPHINGGTTIRFTLNYRRDLDPAWYFHPLQRAGVEQMAGLIIDELMLRKHQEAY